MSPEVRRRRRAGPMRWLRRLRRLRRDRPVVVVVTTVVVGCLLVGLWCGWRVWSVSRSLGEVAESGEVLRAALVRGDAQGARAALDRYQDAAEAAESATSGPTWAVFGTVPLLGDDADGVALAARVLADLGRDGLPPVVDAADQLTAEAFQPRDHVFPVEAISALDQPAEDSEAAFVSAQTELDGVDAGGFVGPLRTRFETLRDLVDDGASALDSVYRASRLMPSLLGRDRTHHYLMVLQNNAEIRSGGGLPGAVTLLSARNGRVDIVEQADMSDLNPPAGDPGVPQTAEETALFGDRLGRIPVNASLTPDFVRAAELARAHWERDGRQRLDGVLFVDPVTVSYLLQGIGPVAVPAWEPVTAGNVVASVENTIYLSRPTRAEHSDYQQAVAKAVFNAFAAGRGESAEIIRGLVRGVAEGRIRMHFFGEDQQQIAGEEIAGEFPIEAGDVPEVGLYLNDATESKLSYYLDHQAAVFSRSCPDGVQEIGGQVILRNDAPQNAADLPATVIGVAWQETGLAPGDLALQLYLTAPVGGTIEEIAIDRRDVEPVTVDYAGREVAAIAVTIAPRESTTIDFVLRSGAGQTGDPVLQVTPGAKPENESARARSAC